MITIPRCSLLSITNNNISRLLLPMLLLILAVFAVSRPVIETTAHKAFSFVILLLLEIGSLSSLVLHFSLPFALVFVVLEVLFLHHMGARTSLIATSPRVLCSRLLFNIKRADEIHHCELLSLMLQRSSKILLGRRQLGNDTASHKLIRQRTIEGIKLLCKRL